VGWVVGGGGGGGGGGRVVVVGGGGVGVCLPISDFSKFVTAAAQARRRMDQLQYANSSGAGVMSNSEEAINQIIYRVRLSTQLSSRWMKCKTSNLPTYFGRH